MRAPATCSSVDGSMGATVAAECCRSRNTFTIASTPTMYRWDVTRTILSILLLISWLIPIYLLIETHSHTSLLKANDAKLKAEIDHLRGQYERLASAKYDPSNGLPAIQADNNQGQSQRLVNIFVETELEDGQDKRQFYKTFGSTASGVLFGSVKKLAEHLRKRVLVTGGAGFVGSHLVDSLMLEGHEVIVCDNFYTGRKSNIEHWQGHPNFEMINHDIINPLTIEADQIYHLASPASPVHYMANPIKTIKTNTIGTINMLGLAKRVGARILIASTSEIYGDPEVHPQSEAYWGNANTVGPRSCYDESKRLSESLAVAYNKRENVSIGIARIFNTYGPRMHPNDGRVVSNFIMQALNNESLTVYGSGAQTRSFQYITDLVEGLKKLMNSQVDSPVNLGNPDEMTIYSLAHQIKSILRHSTSDITFNKLPQDDPHRRKPDVDKAKSLLNWQPRVPLIHGLQRTIEYFAQEIK